MWAYTFILTTTLCLQAIMRYYIYRQHLIRQDRKNDFLHVISSNVGRNSLNNRPVISLLWYFSYVWPLIHWLSYSYSSNYIVSYISKERKNKIDTKLYITIVLDISIVSMYLYIGKAMYHEKYKATKCIAINAFISWLLHVGLICVFNEAWLLAGMLYQCIKFVKIFQID